MIVKKMGLLLLILNTICNGMQSQSYTGQLVDEENYPISFALIYSGENNHTHSNETGRFTINEVNKGDTLYITHLSYMTKRHIVGDIDQIAEISLQSANVSIEGIVISNAKSAADILSELDINIRPVNSSQEVLTQVPGLIIGQHAGGGKAEQIFLRGFDIDHGTDIAISVDGLPVNMVSHAHGQGYADLHFLIPETIRDFDFGLGPYYGQKGNFNTAGYVDFTTKKKVNEQLLKLEFGQFNSRRLLSVLNLLDKGNSSAYIATEYLAGDGPFESPQNFTRINVFGKLLKSYDNNSSLELSLSHFDSEWDASGQIPQRAVDSGLITRFGAIDDTEGGFTSRSNANLNYIKPINSKSIIKNRLYYSNYNFELFSNFTFFLEDPENGDQIVQRENRNLFGFNSDYSRTDIKNNFTINTKVGTHLRVDNSNNNQLARTANRTQVLEDIQNGDVTEYNWGSYLESELEVGLLAFSAALRYDFFDYRYLNKLRGQEGTQTSKNILSPKLRLSYKAHRSLQIYAKAGKGFHTNDTRALLNDPDLETIPAAYGADLGIVWKPHATLFINAAYWYLFLEQEFVYVGDAGIVEPSGESLRRGYDLSLRYQPIDWINFNADINYTIARSLNTPSEENFIPLAPDFTVKTGITIKSPSGISGGLDIRHIDDRPATEDNAIVAPGYTVVDMNVSYSFSKLTLGIQIQNLLNTEWNETQFATESRLADEVESVTEIHFTPGVPFYTRGSISYTF
jgi:hypothetical protein